MANSNVMRFIYEVFGQGAGMESYKIYTSSGINQGDMMQWDPNARVATNALLASGSIFLGVSDDCNPMAGLGTASNPLTLGAARIKSSGIFVFKTTSGETYVHRTPVYQGADQQTISTVGSTRMIGRVHLPDGSSVTGAAGTSVNVNVMGDLTNNSLLPSSAIS
jgi:hypothetical protein